MLFAILEERGQFIVYEPLTNLPDIPDPLLISGLLMALQHFARGAVRDEMTDIGFQKQRYFLIRSKQHLIYILAMANDAITGIKMHQLIPLIKTILAETMDTVDTFLDLYNHFLFTKRIVLQKQDWTSRVRQVYQEVPFRIILKPLLLDIYQDLYHSLKMYLK